MSKVRVACSSRYAIRVHYLFLECKGNISVIMTFHCNYFHYKVKFWYFIGNDFYEYSKGAILSPNIISIIFISFCWELSHNKQQFQKYKYTYTWKGTKIVACYVVLTTWAWLFNLENILLMHLPPSIVRHKKKMKMKKKNSFLCQLNKINKLRYMYFE